MPRRIRRLGVGVLADPEKGMIEWLCFGYRPSPTVPTGTALLRYHLTPGTLTHSSITRGAEATVVPCEWQ
jgi:hypothetical protein